MVEIRAFCICLFLISKGTLNFKKREGQRKHSALHIPEFPGVKTTSMSFSNNTTNFQKQTQVKRLNYDP